MLNTSTSTCSYGKISVSLDRVDPDVQDFARSNLKVLLNQVCECGCRAQCAVCDDDFSVTPPEAYLYERFSIFSLICGPCDTAIQAMLVQPLLLRQAADFLANGVGRVRRAG